MDFFIFEKLNNIVKKYTDAFIFGNNTENLCLQLIAFTTEENVEFILNDIDMNLPSHINFEHKNENGKLTVLFKEIV